MVVMGFLMVLIRYSGTFASATALSGPQVWRKEGQTPTSYFSWASVS